MRLHGHVWDTHVQTLQYTLALHSYHLQAYQHARCPSWVEMNIGSSEGRPERLFRIGMIVWICSLHLDPREVLLQQSIQSQPSFCRRLIHPMQPAHGGKMLHMTMQVNSNSRACFLRIPLLFTWMFIFESNSANCHSSITEDKYSNPRLPQIRLSSSPCASLDLSQQCKNQGQQTSLQKTAGGWKSSFIASWLSALSQKAQKVQVYRGKVLRRWCQSPTVLITWGQFNNSAIMLCGRDKAHDAEEKTVRTA